MSTDLDMTIITASIRPVVEGKVVRALHALPDFPGFSIIELRGQGRGRGAGGAYRATEYDLAYQRHLQLQIICQSAAAAEICKAIAAAAWTGHKGDGVIFTERADTFVRIREAGRAEEASE